MSPLAQSEDILLAESRWQREAMTPAYLRDEAEKNARRIRVLVDAGQYEQARELLLETRDLCLAAVAKEQAA